jgi:TonB-linked SusC/RagA family outer membrane protein
MALSRWKAIATGALACALLGGAAAAAHAQATIAGRVTSQASGEPLQESRVIVVGTSLFGSTGADGRFSIRNVPAGQHEMRVIRVGYQEQKKPVTVAAGQTTEVDFALQQVVVQLQEVVTTATGEQRRVELGNAVATIDAAKVTATAPVMNLSDLLNSRAPGVVITSGTQTGTGSRVRIRGISSLNLGNDPIYIIDGIRMTSNNGNISFGTGGNNPGRLQDLNPEEVENIEIVKGPSAATLYGTDAANGVIVITTKKGRAGSARWNTYAEGGLLQDRNNYPWNYTIAGHFPGQSTYRECALPTISSGACILDSVRTYSPFHDPDATPLGLGNRSQFGAQLSGGSDLLRYFLSAEREDETGVLRLPDFEVRRFDSAGTQPIRNFTRRPNVLAKNSFRLNVGAAINPKLDVSTNVGYINSDTRYTLESNATAGLGSQAFGGPGYKTNGTVAGTGTPLNGYRAWTPGYTWQEKIGQRINRFIGSANVQWRPTSWMQNRMNVGSDLTDRVDEDLRYRGEGPPLNSTYRDGFKGNARTNIRNLTADIGSTANFNPKDYLNSKTTLGVQYVNYQLDQNEADGQNLPPGTQTAGSGAIPTANEETVLNRTLGAFIEEAVAIRDRLFLTAALRTDQNSAFGTNFQKVVYPKLSFSWIISEEPFFPAMSWLNSLRLRSAYGASGVQPGPNDALRTFSTTTPNIKGVDQPGVVQNQIGNKDLRPERTAEFEAGFETKLFNNRASIDLTYYNKYTKDALISAIVPGSAGTATSVRRNLGGTKNVGWELLLTSQLVDRPMFAWDVTINGSTNANKLVSLGGTPPIIGTSTRVVEGYPVRAFWERKILGWQDKNHDGILTYDSIPALNEVFVADSATFIGYNQPRHNVNLTTGIDLFQRRLRLQTLIDYRGGSYWYNNTERIRCVSRQNCNGLMNPEASFEEQAMVVATLNHPSKTLAGFFQKGDFVKWREVSATWSVPERFAAMMRARSVALTFSARNLGVLTKYRGVDPETDFTASEGGDTPSDFQTIGPPTYFIVRLNLGF